MKRFRNLVIGGIQTKVFNLILLTVILLSGAIWFLSNYQANILKDLADKSNLRQQESIQAITDSVMESVIDQSMSRSTRLEAELADDLFDALQARVRMLGEYAGKLFAVKYKHAVHAFCLLYDIWLCSERNWGNKTLCTRRESEGAESSNQIEIFKI